MSRLAATDLLSKTDYEAGRDAYRRRVMVLKQKRRVLVGDHCSVHFECRETMRYQVHEMLRAEDNWSRPGAVEDELHAYNPLIPGPGELAATVMFEYATAEERSTHLPRFVGIDRHVWLRIGVESPLLAEFDRGQIDDRGVSSVQYVKWRLAPAHVSALVTPGTVVRLVIDHPAYSAQSVLSEETRAEIAQDPVAG
jgi:hypothetical protein